MKRRSIGLILLLLLISPILIAATPAAQNYEDIGMAVYRKGLYSKAIEYFQKAVQADPNDAQAYEKMGDAYAQMNDVPNARDSYKQSLQIQSNNPALRSKLADLINSDASSSNGRENAAVNPPEGNNGTETQTVDRFQNRPPEGPKPAPQYKDGLNPVDHAKFWSSLQIGYTYASLPDLSGSATNINSGAYVNPDTALQFPYNGNSVFSNSGLHLGAQVGFLINPYMGIAIGGKYIAMTDYTADVTYKNGFQDSESETLSPAVVPITLDYFLFLPDAGGRFFVSAGVGYYIGVVNVNETYSYSNFYNQQESTVPENWQGNLYSGSIGFQLGIGREFAITDRVGIALYAQSRYVQITNFRGTVSDQYGNPWDVALVNGTTNGVAEIDSPANIGTATGERNTTLDFTGFDVGFALNFYSF